MGRYLLPFGCQTLEKAVARILGSLPADEEAALHRNIWKLIHSTLKGHVHVCTAPASLFRDLRERIERAVEKLAEESLGRAHAAEMYLERQAEHADADADLASAFDQAQPELGTGNRAHFRFRIQHPRRAPWAGRRTVPRFPWSDTPFPTCRCSSAVSTDDIVFYREQSFANLDDLPQMGAVAQEQYRQVLTTAQFGPHSRADIRW